MGADLVTVSPELPLGAMRAIRENKAMIAYGRLPLMLMMRCAISDGGEHCRTKGNGGFTDFIEKNFICRSALTDRTGASFPLLGMYDCSNVLYNSVPLYMADRLDTLYSSGVSTLHFIFSTENKADVRNVIHAYKNGLPPADPSAVRRIK
jgi:putative protease